MEQRDPPRAMMTRQAIAPASSPYVCSTCGDDPANDYHLPASYRSAGGEVQRVCPSCIETGLAKKSFRKKLCKEPNSGFDHSISLLSPAGAS